MTEVWRTLRQWSSTLSDEVKPIEMIAAFLRIGSKYEIRQLRNQALKLLSARYPDSIEGWDIAEHLSEDIPQIQDSLVNHIMVANLAREMEFYAILPACFLEIWKCGYESVLYGALDEANPRVGEIVAQLTPENQRMAMTGMFRIIEEQHDTSFDCLHADSQLFPACAQPMQCADARMRAFCYLFRGQPNCIAFEPLEGFHCQYGICQGCSSGNRGRSVSPR